MLWSASRLGSVKRLWDLRSERSAKTFPRQKESSILYTTKYTAPDNYETRESWLAGKALEDADGAGGAIPIVIIVVIIVVNTERLIWPCGKTSVGFL